MVVVSNSTVTMGDVAEVMQGYINDTGEEPLPVSWLLSGEEEQFEQHVSICAGAISPTSGGHFRLDAMFAACGSVRV